MRSIAGALLASAQISVGTSRRSVPHTFSFMRLNRSIRLPQIRVSVVVALLAFAGCQSGDKAGQAGQSRAAADTLSDSVLTEKLENGRYEGNPKAPIWIVMVSDFQCPYCKQWHDDAYPMLIKDYVKTGKVRLAYVNFPLSMHQNAHAAATAAMCAGAQGKFWPMHDALFASQGKWETEKNPSTTFDSLAKSIGVDVASYHSCLSSPAIASLIAGDQDRAQRGGVNSTPSFWVGSKMIEGAVPAAEMRAAVDQALAAPATAPATPTPTTGTQQ